MFGVGTFEIVLVLAIALIVLGPDRLPQAMGTVGRWVRELRRLTGEFRKEFDEEILMLQGEVEMLRQEAELTRQELQEIQSDLVETIGGVQEDLEEAGEDIRAELNMAEDIIQGSDPDSTAIATATPVSKGWTRPDATDPSDAMYAAIQDTFTTPNGRAATSPLPVVPEPASTPPQVPTPSTPPQVPTPSTPAPAASIPPQVPTPSAPAESALNLGARLDTMHAEVADLAEAGAEQSVQRFAPQSGQFGTLLEVVATADEETLEKARAELKRRAAADAIKLAHLNGKGPAGIALAWAAQRQSQVPDGSIEVDTREEGRVRIRMNVCPYGLTKGSEVRTCKLSNVYDEALAEQMGVVGKYEQRLTTMQPFCEFVVQTLEKAAEVPEDEWMAMNVMEPVATDPRALAGKPNGPTAAEEVPADTD